MFDPDTKQVIYNHQGQSQVGKGNKAFVVTIAQDEEIESYSRTSKSENFGVNFGFGDGIASFGLNCNKVKTREPSEQRHKNSDSMQRELQGTGQPGGSKSKVVPVD